ncbi:MAG: sigma 54-interacting transcriptional regulator [Pirellulales bacterium]|nr:sigma 54-interacting transcriptional regulator [Pirellulales bacterium]
MNEVTLLQLSVWREVCRHLEIATSTATIAGLLRPLVPLDLLFVRRFLPNGNSLQTVAYGSHDGSSMREIADIPISPTRYKRLLTWAANGKPLQNRSRIAAGDIALLAGPVEGDLLVGPLVGAEGPIGILGLHCAAFGILTPEQVEIFSSLLEPFSAALENDQRLHELATLREAAEADRRSLLTRLGRTETGETIVGAEVGLRHVMERVDLVSQSDVPVMILGETGTGKEVVSRAIHNRSKRHSAPFIRVNCGAIPAELIDSQLFGHERGSFTGAADTRKGWFERADGGTLFLDEIGELPLPAQVRLLRVLQDGFIERVGGQQPLRVDVRIIAATHRDLPEMVKEGTFREDLWYRIAVFPILLPPLRERREDIPLLARHFAERAAKRFGLPFVEPSPHDLNILRQYVWPGNIRELGAVIDRAAILGDGKSLEVAKALGNEATPSGGSRSLSTLKELREPNPVTSLSTAYESGGGFATLDQALRSHIERALQATRGKIEGPHGAAKLLDINPHTLRAKMRKLKLKWSDYRSPQIN